jgi:hypothetical protein
VANTTFGNLKIGALRRSDHYNSSDSTLLELAGGIINDCLSEIQSETRDSMYWKDLDNTVSTVADQAYVDLSETNILEILAVYQRETDTKLKRISKEKYLQIVPDSTAYAGTPDFAYAEEQIIDGSGQNIFRLFLVPTPSSVITMRYDFLKNPRFSVDGTGADSEFSPLPSNYDELIYAMFRPRFFLVIDPENTGRYQAAQVYADKLYMKYKNMLNSKADHRYQAGSFRAQAIRTFNVSDTPTP